jgi:glycosyltransferase involved in cell wall biosynthesis
MSLQMISPRVLAKFVRAPEDVVVIYELALVGLYAGLSKLFRPRRRVVSMVENDYEHLGPTGTARLKVAFRKLVARMIDGFAANNAPARNYLIETLGVPPEKILVGWWLSGLPSDLKPNLPDGVVPPDDRPIFACASRLIAPKGVDLLIDAVATYQAEFGPCQLYVLGDGPERDALAEQAGRLGVADSVVFLGSVDHAVFKAVLQASDVFVFPTLRDLVGRVVVEALTIGVPVVVSPLTGAAGTIVQDGVNGLIADPRDSGALAAAMHRAVEPETLRALRDGVAKTNVPLFPEAGIEVIVRSVEQARSGARRGVQAVP